MLSLSQNSNMNFASLVTFCNAIFAVIFTHIVSEGVEGNVSPNFLFSLTISCWHILARSRSSLVLPAAERAELELRHKFPYLLQPAK